MIYKILLFLSRYQKWETLEQYENIIGLTYLKRKSRKLWLKNREGKYWLALSPEKLDKTNSLVTDDTKYEIHYWVNYGDNNTYGWFTVEQIIKWLTEPETELHTLGGTKER